MSEHRYYAISDGDGWAYYRTRDDHVEFWDGTSWRTSVLPNRLAFLDDAMAGGARVREVLDLAEVPS